MPPGINFEINFLQEWTVHHTRFHANWTSPLKKGEFKDL